jgi:class 3 adenylate cyclase/tetratricopeptide (TPR) repeat protein
LEPFARWLTDIGLEGHAGLFAQHEIDFDVITSLTEVDLQALGLPLGARRRLLQAVARLDGQGAAITVLPPAASLATPAGDRRQLTVMFCDLVGSTALSEKLDPEDLRALLDDYRARCAEIITHYDGFVARYVGDGILIYFGWPKAHEEDAERALRAALEIVQAVQRTVFAEPLAVRIGIATGPVVVGVQTELLDESKLAVGSTPNLAARLQGLAAADQVVIASSTSRLVGKAFELLDMGEHELKGIAEPVHAWRVIAVSDLASRFETATRGLITPLVGREQEIALLLDRWQQGQEGEGQVVILSGEPGIGKSRVLRELRLQLEARKVTTMRFQCSPYHVNSTLYPSIDNFNRALKFGRDESTDTKLDKLEALIVARYGRPLADVRFIAALLSVPCDERYGALAITPQKQKDETLRTLVDISEAAARRRPTVMLFEDIHWADPTMLEVTGLLIHRIKTVPLLLVITHRPEFQPQWGGHGHVSTLNLSKLTRAQSGAIVDKLTGGKALPRELLKQILSKTDGVPLYVEELTKAILESGEINDAGNHFDYADAARTVTIPATLRDSLMARLDRHQPAKDIAQIGAVIGRVFSYKVIAAVATHTQTDLDRALDQFSESGLGFRRGTPPEATYTFKHALVQDTAYESVLKGRRQTLHARIAQVLEADLPKTKDTEPELLAYHLTAAGETEAAIGYWQKAGLVALKRLALSEAISHLNKGMELIALLPQSAQRDASELNLRTPLGTAWMALKGWAAPEVWSSFHPALGLAKAVGRHQALVPIYHGLYSNVLVQGCIAEALAWAIEMLAFADANNYPDLAIIGHRSAGTAYANLGQFNLACEHCDRVFALYDEGKHRHHADIMSMDPKTSAGIFSALATWILGYPDRAMQVCNDKDAHARRRGHLFDLGYALTLGSLFWGLCREPEQLLARAEEAERLGGSHSLPFISEVLAQLTKGSAWLWAGRRTEGIPQLQGAMERWRAGGALLGVPYFRAVVAEGLALNGDHDGGLQLIEQSLAQIARPGWEERWSLAEVLRLKGWMLQQQGKLDSAQENYLASIDVARQQQAKSWELRTSISLARLWQAQGKHTEACALLAPVYQWFSEGFGTQDLKAAKALLGELRT